jgi:hypothetical protein
VRRLRHYVCMHSPHGNSIYPTIRCLFSAMLSPTTYRRILDKYIADRDADNLQNINANGQIIQHWLDNYQDKIATTNPHYKQAIYRATQMTVWTTRHWSNLDINFLHIYPGRTDMKAFSFSENPRNTPIPAMPDMKSILDQSFTDFLVQKCNDVKENHFLISFVEMTKVYNVPEKAMIDEEDVELCRFVADNSNDTGCRWPMGLFQAPVSSNVGLLAMLRQFGDVCTITTTTKYSQLLLDVNLFWRILKILHNVPSLISYRQNVFLCLGTSICNQQVMPF